MCDNPVRGGGRRRAGGHIWGYSEPGKGTSFKIYLLRVDGDAQALPGRRPSQRPVGGTERILVVEDEAAARKLLVRTLNVAGYTVIEAANGADALLELSSADGQPDLLVTDVVMPQMGGRELATKVLEKHPELPVLYLSGYPRTPSRTTECWTRADGGHHRPSSVASCRNGSTTTTPSMSRPSCMSSERSSCPRTRDHSCSSSRVGYRALFDLSRVGSRARLRFIAASYSWFSAMRARRISATKRDTLMSRSAAATRAQRATRSSRLTVRFLISRSL